MQPTLPVSQVRVVCVSGTSWDEITLPSTLPGWDHLLAENRHQRLMIWPQVCIKNESAEPTGITTK